MPDLSFHVLGAAPVPFAASPLLALEIAVRNAVPGELVQTVALQCQVRVEAQRRPYSPGEQEALRDLFGEPGLWERSLRPLLWAHASVMVPAFAGETVVALPLPCTYDFSVASARYFHALEGGDAPLVLLFSGTAFYARGDGALQIAQVPWSTEARYAMPACVVRETMDLYFPNQAPILLRRDVLDRLGRARSRAGVASWEETVARLLDADEAREAQAGR